MSKLMRSDEASLPGEVVADSNQYLTFRVSASHQSGSVAKDVEVETLDARDFERF